MLSNHTNINKTVLASTFFKSKTTKVDFAIVSPLPEELEHLQKIFAQYPYESLKINGFNFKIYDYHNTRVLLTHTGLGTTFAACAATLICQHFHPDYFLLLGTAGGINPELKIKDVVIVEKAFEAEMLETFQSLKENSLENCLVHPLNKREFPCVYEADAQLVSIASSLDFNSIKVHTGTTVSSNLFPAPSDLFKKIQQLFPFSIDMETSAIYQVAWLLGIPALAIRGVSNMLNADGKDDNISALDFKGSMETATLVLKKILDSIIKLRLQKQQTSTLQSDINKEINEVIKDLELEPHPEGGYYKRKFSSSHFIKSLNKKRYNDEERIAGSSIYYLLRGNDFSAWHRLKSDEIWHHYKGCAIRIYVINEQGVLTTHLLGDPAVYENAVFQVAIPADHWFAAEVVEKSSYSLAGCTVSPGFEFTDWELAHSESLIKQFPQHEDIINQFALLKEQPQETVRLKSNL